MKRFIYLCTCLLILSGCSTLRSVGNNEAYVLTPCAAHSDGAIERDGTWYRRIIVGLRDDARVTYHGPDGTDVTVDNAGQPSFAHDLATTVQAIAVKQAMDD